MPIDVRMPDGTLVKNVPDNITQADLLARYNAFTAQPATPVAPAVEVTPQAPQVGPEGAPIPSILQNKEPPIPEQTILQKLVGVEPTREPKGPGARELASDIYQAAKQFPEQLASSAIQAYQGKDAEAIAQDSTANKIVDDARKSAEANMSMKGAEDTYTDFLGAKIKRSDIRNLPQNLSFSLVAMGSALLSGLGTTVASAPVAGPAAPLVGTGAGAVAAGKVAYNIDTNSFLRDFREGLNQASIEQRGIPITNEEFVKIAQSPEMQAKAKEFNLDVKGKGAVDELAKIHGLHEAGWEAISSTVGLGAGKYIFKEALKGKVLKPVAAFTGELGLELAGETATQLGQSNVERKAGMHQDAERSWSSAADWKKSYEEVAGPTLLTTAVLGGAPAAAGAAKRVFTKATQPPAQQERVEPEITTPEAPSTPPPAETVTSDKVLSLAQTRLNEIETKMNGTPDYEGVGPDGKPRIVKGEQPQLINDQERAEYDFLKNNITDPNAIAKTYGLTIDEKAGLPAKETTEVKTSHDTQAMIDELSGKEIEFVPEEEQKTAEPSTQIPKSELPIGSKVSWNDDGNQVESTILDSMSKAGITMYKVTSTDASKPNGVWVDSSNLEPITEKPSEEPTGVISETEKEFVPVGGRLINKADADKLARESAIALQQNLATQEAEKEKQLKQESREEKFREPPTQTLSARLVQEGGISREQKRDMLGETGKVETYDHVFRLKGNDLRTLIKDGKLDDYLPPELRTSATPYEKLYDAEPAYNYISDMIKTGEKVRTYDYEMAKLQHENMVYEKNLAKQQMTPNEAARAAAAEEQGKEYFNVEVPIPTVTEQELLSQFSKQAQEYISELPVFEEAKQNKSFKIEMNKLRRAIKKGMVSEADIIPAIDQIYESTQKEKEPLERKRGVEIIKEKLLAAKRRGELAPEAVDMALFLIDKNPAMVKDLAISIAANKRDGRAGGYAPLARLATIFKYSPNKETAVHEILHHLERMMPTDIQAAIRKAWARSLKVSAERAFGGKNETLKQYYRDLIDYHATGDQKAEKRAINLLATNAVGYDHYQNFNPSEFWAVNGSGIVQNRYNADISESMVERIKNWLSEFVEKVKSLFNLQSDAAVIRALDSVAKGDGKFITDMIHADTEAYSIDRPLKTFKPTEDGVADDFGAKVSNQRVKELESLVNKLSEWYKKPAATYKNIKEDRTYVEIMQDPYDNMSINNPSKSALTKVTNNVLDKIDELLKNSTNEEIRNAKSYVFREAFERAQESNIDVIKAQPREYLNIERKAPHEFEKSDIPEDAEEYTIPANTELYHGAHGDRANEILESGSILKARPPITSGGGMLFEGDLVWFGDKRTAKGHAASAIDTFAAAADREAGRPRKPGKVFGFITDKPLKLINRSRPLTAEEAAYFNKVFRIDEIYDGHKNLKEGEGVYKAAWRAHDGLPYDKKTYRTTPWPIILKHLGYDGYFDDSGIALNIGDVKTKLLDNVERPVEKEYPNISRPPKNYRGQEVLPQWHGPEESKIDEWIYRLQNKQIDTKRVQELIGDIEEDWNVYEKEQLYHGRTAAGIRNFLLKELLPVIKEIERLKISPEEVRTYLHNRHAEERNIQMNKINPDIYDETTGRTIPNPLKDKGSGISTADARAYLAGLDPARKQILEQIANKFDQMVKGTQQILINSGAESADTIAKWNSTYEHYVPLFRVEDEMARPTGMGGTGQGFGVRGAFSKRAMGSEKDVQDILSNIIAQRERALIRAEKIRVGRALYGLAIQNPNPDFWLPINPDAIRNKKQAIAELRRMGVPDAEQMIENLMAEPRERYLKKTRAAEEGFEPDEDFDFDSGLPVNESKEVVASKINVMARYKDFVFPVRINGKDRYIFFNKNDPRALRMVQSLKNLDVDQLGILESLFGKATRWFKNVNTQYNPVFGLVNFLRDFGGTFLNLTTTEIKGKQAQVIAGAYKAMGGILNVHRAERKGKPLPTGPWAKLYQEYRDEGSQTGYRDSLIRNQEEMQIIEHTLSQFKDGNTKKAFYAVLGGLTDYNDMMENAFRLSAYKVARDQGLSKQKAAIIAKNLTVNFDRKGALTPSANALFAFFNANVQGTERIYQTLKGPKGRMIIGGGILAGMVQALMLASAGYGDDDPPEFVREKNFIIPLLDGTYITVPYPLGYNILPNSGRIVMDFMIRGGRDPGKHVTSLMSSIMNSFNPLGSTGFSFQTLTPTALDPLVALTENKDAFGRPIYRPDRSTAPTPGYTRSRDTASTLGKGIAEFLNWASGGTKYQKGTLFGPFSSPTGDEVDFLAGQIGGGLYREISKAAKAIGAQSTGEALAPYQRPLVSRFYGETGSPAAVSQTFYNNVIRMTDHENEIKGRMTHREDVESYLNEHPEARLWKRANTVENKINELNKRKRMFIDRGFPKERIQAIDAQKTMLMQRFNDQVSKLTPE